MDSDKKCHPINSLKNKHGQGHMAATEVLKIHIWYYDAKSVIITIIINYNNDHNNYGSGGVRNDDNGGGHDDDNN